MMNKIKHFLFFILGMIYMVCIFGVFNLPKDNVLLVFSILGFFAGTILSLLGIGKFLFDYWDK